MIITANNNTSGNLVARIAIIENEITFGESPGSNGEKDFIKVLKQFLPSPGGIDIADVWIPDQTETFTESWTFENVYDLDEIAVIAYIQDNDTKEIMQGAFAKTVVLHELDAKLSKLHEFPEFICPGDPQAIFSPRVVVTNYGSTPITSFDVECKINNNEPEVYNWTGTLNQLDPVVIHYSDLNYGMLNENNSITATVVNINGLDNDDNPANDEDLETFNATITISPTSQIRFRSGGMGGDFIWRIVCTGDSDVPDEYANYTGDYNGADTNTININLPEDCWKFILKNNNYSGTNENDFFFEIVDRGEVQLRTEHIGYYLHIPYYVSIYAGIPSTTYNDDLLIYPNPSSGFVNLTNTQTADVYIYDLQGSLRMIKKEVSPNGVLNLSKLKNGNYLLKVMQEDNLSTEIITLLK